MAGGLHHFVKRARRHWVNAFLKQNFAQSSWLGGLESSPWRRRAGRSAKKGHELTPTYLSSLSMTCELNNKNADTSHGPIFHRCSLSAHRQNLAKASYHNTQHHNSEIYNGGQFRPYYKSTKSSVSKFLLVKRMIGLRA
jgi:hypothetical protein